MAERGTLSQRGVAGILEDLHHGKKTGRLRFSRRAEPEGGARPEGIAKDVWLEHGEIVSSGTNEPREYLGQYLIAAGKITEKDFIRAYRTQVETRVLFGKVLAMFGIVTEAEVETALRGKTEETILDVFLWPDGGWEWDEGATLQGQRLPISIDVPGLIAEGERRALDWSVIRQTIPDFDFEVELVPTKPGPTPLAPRDAAIVRELGRRRPPAEAALELRLSPYQFLQRVHELQKRARLKILRRPAGSAPAPAAVPARATVPAPPPEELVGPAQADAAVFGDRADDAKRFAVAPDGAVLSARELRTRIPELLKSEEELLSVRVDAEEGYLLSRIDGEWDVATVAALCPFKETVALERVAGLAARGIVRLREP